MKKGGGTASTIIIGPSKSVLVYALHSLEYVLGLARFRVFVPNLKGIIHKEFVPTGQTVKAVFYVGVSKCLVSRDLTNSAKIP